MASDTGLLEMFAENRKQTENDITKADFIHVKRTTFLNKMKIGIHLEKLK